MPYIVYSCITATGGVSWRTGSFSSLDTLYSDLQKRGEQIDRFFEFPDATNQLITGLRGKLKTDQIIEFCSYLSVYIQGGLDLQTALADLSISSKEGAVRSTSERIRTELFNGLSLSEAMQRTQQFPDVVISMARIGESSGNLDQMLEDAAAYIGRIQEIRSAAMRAMIYPLFTLLMLTTTGLFWMLVVVPKLANVYITMGVELPMATRALIAMSDFFSSGWLLIVIVVVATVIVFSVARRQRGIRQTIDHLMWGFPIFGNVIRSAQEAFFFQYLALVYKAGVPIAEAIGGLVETTQNRFFRSRIRRIPEYLRMGLSLRESFQRCNIFMPLDIRMVAIGEQTGSLDAQLTKLATMYMKKVQAAVELLTKAIEPLLMVVMGLFFVFFVVAMLGPIYTLVANMMATVGG